MLTTADAEWVGDRKIMARGQRATSLTEPKMQLRIRVAIVQKRLEKKSRNSSGRTGGKRTREA